MTGEAITILLVEDDAAHAEIVRRNLEQSRLANHLIHVGDGQEALDYLHRTDKYPDAVRPGLVLLDLRLPKVDGLEVLREIKQDADLASIPVVVLTTSAAEFDVAQAYAHRANSYVVKPVDFGQFVDLMKTLGYYWLIWNRYPSG
jgi:CheY-like chemotaxis protein